MGGTCVSRPLNLLQMAVRIANAHVPGGPVRDSMKAYRVITDAPQGVCIGFRPSEEALEAIGGDVDEWNVAEDDGSETDGSEDAFVWLLPGDGDRISIKRMEFEKAAAQDILPLGPD